MEQPQKTQFSDAKASSLGMAGAIALAKSEVAAMSDATIDGVSRCERAPDGSWTVVLDLVESPARMGENDLLAAYELLIDPDGHVVRIERMQRYRREQGGA